MSVKLLVLFLAVIRVKSLDLPISKDKTYGVFDVRKEQDLCTIKCLDNSSHVGCQCNGGGLDNKECKTYPPGDQVEFREEMVEWHNFYRNKIAMGELPSIKPDEPMYTVDYDLSLEYMATCTSYKCRAEKDTCFPLKKFTKFVQNIFYWQTTELLNYKLLVNIAVKSWYNEIPFIKPEKKVDMQWGHWSALVWPNVTHVGCATRYLEKPDEVQFLVVIYVVCNYGSNVKTKEAGEGTLKKCSQCPNTTVCNDDFPKLCGEVGLIPIADIEIIINGTVVTDKKPEEGGLSVNKIIMIVVFSVVLGIVVIFVIVYKFILKK